MSPVACGLSLDVVLLTTVHWYSRVFSRLVDRHDCPIYSPNRRRRDAALLFACVQVERKQRQAEKDRRMRMTREELQAELDKEKKKEMKKMMPKAKAMMKMK